MAAESLLPSGRVTETHFLPLFSGTLTAVNRSFSKVWLLRQRHDRRTAHWPSAEWSSNGVAAMLVRIAPLGVERRTLAVHPSSSPCRGSHGLLAVCHAGRCAHRGYPGLWPLGSRVAPTLSFCALQAGRPLRICCDKGRKAQPTLTL